MTYFSHKMFFISVPLEFPIISREHFNRWYSLRAYYIALTLADFPIQLLCTFFFILISYLMTWQPMEISRFFLFFFMVLMSGLVGQSIGLVVGASLNVTVSFVSHTLMQHKKQILFLNSTDQYLDPFSFHHG